MCFYFEIDIVLGDHFGIEFRSESFLERTDIRMSLNLQRYYTVKVVGNLPCFTYFGSIELVSAERLCFISRTIWQKEISVYEFLGTKYTEV